MCGIAGVVALDGRAIPTDRLKAMTDVIAHRGPDDAGYLLGDVRGGSARALAEGQFQSLRPDLVAWQSAAGQRTIHEHPPSLFFGHRRLSILDLSPRAHQPMASPDGQLWCVYNGEVYNFRELRAELEALGEDFASTSDTEVVLRAFRQWGPACVERFNGMFALAVWDVPGRKVFFARDRFGIKPLYTLQRDGRLYFGSEVKSILAALDTPPGVDLLAMNEYFSFQNVLSDRTLFEGVRLLPPGTMMTADLAAGTVASRRYWDFDFHEETSEDIETVRERLYELISQAVVRQCVSDVSVGSYLSGGMDSGTITAVAARHLGRICTFTGGFDLSDAADHEQVFDEREAAEHMASVFQTEHYESVLHAGDMPAVMDKLVWHLEDLRVGQCYPNYYISRLAGKFVKVVLCGTGGDELFGGYPWRYAAAVGASHDDYVQNYYKYWKRLVRNRDKPAFFQPGVVERLAGLSDAGAVPFQDHTLRMFQRVFGEGVSADTIGEQVNWSLYFECKTFLHGLLVVEDKLSMAHSLETRVPLLDNDLVDFACRVPVRWKVAGLEDLQRMDENMLAKKHLYRDRFQAGKNILREAMGRILPAEITRGRKQGFSAPDESWFRGRAEPFVRDTLLSPSARLREYVSPAYLAEAVDRHVHGQENRRLLIWSLLCMESWLKQFQATPAKPGGN